MASYLTSSQRHILTNRSQGYAHVDFCSKEAVEAALTLSGQELGGWPVFVERPQSNFIAKLEDKPKHCVTIWAGVPLEVDPIRRCSLTSVVPDLFILVLRHQAKHEDLHQFFGECGRLKRVEISGGPPDRQKSAHVEFFETESVDKAVTLASTKKFMGFPIKVDFVSGKQALLKPRRERPDSGEPLSA
jgi:RNA recognition motif-containing protein